MAFKTQEIMFSDTLILKNFSGEHAPGPPQKLAHLALTCTPPSTFAMLDTALVCKWIDDFKFLPSLAMRMSRLRTMTAGHVLVDLAIINFNNSDYFYF